MFGIVFFRKDYVYALDLSLLLLRVSVCVRVCVFVYVVLVLLVLVGSIVRPLLLRFSRQDESAMLLQAATEAASQVVLFFLTFSDPFRL